MLIFFFFFFLWQQSKFSRSSPPYFYIPIWQSRKKIQEHTFFYVYIAARSRIQQEHYLMILCPTIQEDTRTVMFF